MGSARGRRVEPDRQELLEVLMNTQWEVPAIIKVFPELVADSKNEKE